MFSSLFTFILQLPPGTRNPSDNTPVDFTNPFNWIVFIILPIAVAIYYIYWRKSKRKDQD